ncbi:hypothetical protein THAOC_11016, partial [Thalassiosira oceanica]
GLCRWTDWDNEDDYSDWQGQESLPGSGTIGLLLDLDKGTLSVFKDGRRLGVMKEGLGGELFYLSMSSRRGAELRPVSEFKLERCSGLPRRALSMESQALPLKNHDRKFARLAWLEMFISFPGRSRLATPRVVLAELRPAVGIGRSVRLDGHRRDERGPRARLERDRRQQPGDPRPVPRTGSLPPPEEEYGRADIGRTSPSPSPLLEGRRHPLPATGEGRSSGRRTVLGRGSRLRRAACVPALFSPSAVRSTPRPVPGELRAKERESKGRRGSAEGGGGGAPLPHPAAPGKPGPLEAAAGGAKASDDEPAASAGTLRVESSRRSARTNGRSSRRWPLARGTIPPSPGGRTWSSSASLPNRISSLCRRLILAFRFHSPSGLKRLMLKVPPFHVYEFVNPVLRTTACTYSSLVYEFVNRGLKS